MADGDTQAPRGEKPPLRQRLSALFAEYGRVAIVTYFSLSILTIIGFSIAFAVGASPSTASGFFGVLAAGWVAAKATLPVRILVTLGITPGIAYIVNRIRRRKSVAVDAAPDPGAGL